MVGSPTIPTASNLTRTKVRELIDGFAEHLLDGSLENCCPTVYRSAFPARLPQRRNSEGASCLRQTRIRAVYAGRCHLTDGLGTRVPGLVDALIAMPIRHGGSCAKNSSTFARGSCLRTRALSHSHSDVNAFIFDVPSKVEVPWHSSPIGGSRVIFSQREYPPSI